MVGAGVVSGCGLSAQEYTPTDICKPQLECCRPKLSLDRPAIEDLLLGSNANLTCTLSGLTEGQEATLTWTPSGGKDAVQGAPQRDDFGCYSVSSVLPGCADPWNRGETFSCTATYTGSTSPKTATIAKNLGGRGPRRRGPHSAPASPSTPLGAPAHRPGGNRGTGCPAGKGALPSPPRPLTWPLCPQGTPSGPRSTCCRRRRRSWPSTSW